METELDQTVKSLLQEMYDFMNNLNIVSLPHHLKSQYDRVFDKLTSIKPRYMDNEQGLEEDIYEPLDQITPDTPPQLPATERPTAGVKRLPPSPPDITSSPSGLRRSNCSTRSWLDETKIPDISVDQLAKSAHQGFLEKRRPDEGSFINKLRNKYQRRYCAISKGIFYYFESETARKQLGAFELQEYEARPAYHLFKEKDKQEGSFELACPGKRTYKFLASNFEEMNSWIFAVARVSNVAHPATIPRPSDIQVEKSPLANDKISIHVGSENETVDQSSGSGSLNSKTNIIPSRRPLPDPTGQEIYNEVEDPPQDIYDEATVGDAEQEVYDDAKAETDVQELYDDATAIEGDTTQEIYDDGGVDNTQEIYDDGAAELQDIYDDAEAPAPLLAAKKPIHFNKRLPVPPKEQRTVTIVKDDYANMFYGLWDCTALKNHELSFKQGEIIQVIERKYESSGWLTGLLNGKVGLVPKNYLTPVYMAA